MLVKIYILLNNKDIAEIPRNKYKQVQLLSVLESSGFTQKPLDIWRQYEDCFT